MEGANVVDKRASEFVSEQELVKVMKERNTDALFVNVYFNDYITSMYRKINIKQLLVNVVKSEGKSETINYYELKKLIPNLWYVVAPRNVKKYLKGDVKAARRLVIKCEDKLFDGKFIYHDCIVKDVNKELMSKIESKYKECVKMWMDDLAKKANKNNDESDEFDDLPDDEIDI